MPRFNTTIDDTSPLITYNPPELWHLGSVAQDPKSTHYFDRGTSTSTVLTSATRVTATFTFNGTGVWLYGAKRLNHGLYSVSLDGNKYTFSGDVPATKDDEFQVALFSASDLTLDTHTLVLENVGTDLKEMFLDVDFIRWETQLGQDDYVLNQTIIRASSPSFQFSGPGWESSGANTRPTEAGLSTDVPGDSATLVFEGDAISIFGSMGPSCGLFGVQVDGGVINTYNASRHESTTNQLIYYGSNLGSGQHILRVTNMQPATGNLTKQTLAIDYAEVVAADAPSSSGISRRETVPTSSSSKSNKSAVIGGLCAALVLLGLLLLGFWLWLRRRRLRHTAKSISPSSLKTFNIDDDVPLQTGSWSSRTSTPDTVRNSETSRGSHIAHGDKFHISPINKPHTLALFDHSSARSAPFANLPYDHASSKNASSSRLTFDGRSSKNTSNSRLPYDGQSSRNTSSSKLPYESSRNASSTKLPHQTSSHKHGKSRTHAPQDGSRKHGKRRHRKKTRDEFAVSVLHLDPHPLPPIPKPGEKGIIPKGRRPSLRNSRILRTGYNIFFAKPGSSNSGSAYAPSTVLTSEISERPTVTLSPVREAPPPLPSSRPQTPQRSLQIANQIDD